MTGGLGLALLIGGWRAVVAAGLGWVGWWAVKKVRDRRRRRITVIDVAEVARLLLVTLSGGVNLVGAFELVTEVVDEPMRSLVERLLRNARIAGLAAALSTVEAPLASLGSHLARAAVTGASLTGALESFLRQIEGDERGLALQRIRTLPVRLVVPLSLLLLPGFVLLVVAPSMVENVRDLTGVALP